MNPATLLAWKKPVTATRTVAIPVFAKEKREAHRCSGIGGRHGKGDKARQGREEYTDGMGNNTTATKEGHKETLSKNENDERGESERASKQETDRERRRKQQSSTTTATTRRNKETSDEGEHLERQRTLSDPFDEARF